MIHQEILNNLNSRYVLLKKGYYYRIVDKLSRTVVVITDPFIDYKKLIKYMIENNVQIFQSINDLPEPIEKPLFISRDFEFKNPKGINVIKFFAKKVYSKNGMEIGTVVSAMTDNRVDSKYKKRIEEKIISYAFTHIYKNEGLKFYSENYDDTISLIILKNFNDLPTEEFQMSEVNIWDW